MRYCLNYSGKGFLPLKIEITPFPDGFHLKKKIHVYTCHSADWVMLHLPISESALEGLCKACPLPSTLPPAST